MHGARWLLATLVAGGVVGREGVGPATADARREVAVLSGGGLISVGGSHYTMFFPDPGAAWQVAVRGAATTWPIVGSVGLAPEAAVSRGIRIGDREEWLALGGLRVAGAPDHPSKHLAYLATRAGWGADSGLVADVGVGADLRWPAARLHVEVEVGALLTRVTTIDGDTDAAMNVRATYVSAHLGVAVGIGF